MHNDRIHKQLLKLMKFILDQIQSGSFDVNHTKNDTKTMIKVQTILNFVDMVTSTSINRDREITKFFIEENSKYIPKWKQNLEQYNETSKGT